MSVFSSDLQELQRQTNTLRDNLKAVTGIDCSGYSIGNCAGVALQKTNTDYVEPDNDETDDYVRPDWYPDIKSILSSAPEIIKDDVTYYPIYIMLMMDTEVSSPFYTANSTSSSAVNYYRGTGGNAYIFSDVVDNNIANANADTLEVGATITHTWDLDKDIADPTNGDKYKVRWVVVYKTSRTTGTLFYCFGDCPCIEIITGDMTWYCGTSNSTNAMYNAQSSKYDKTLKYVEIGEDTKFTQSYMGYGFCQQVFSLEKVVFNCAPINIYPSYFCYMCYNLKKVDMNAKILGFYETTNVSTFNFCQNCNNLKEIDLSGFNGDKICDNFCYNCYNLRTIVVPSSVQFIGDKFCYNCYNLTSVILPSSLIEIGSSFCNACRKLNEIILPENLTISGSLLGNTNLRRIIIPSNLNSIDNGSFSGIYSLKEVILREGLHTFNWNSLANSINIQYFKVPNSITQIDNANINNNGNIKYIELYDNFDISGWRLSNCYFSIECLKGICGWLKDKTGETANTMILGEQNINNLSNLYCVYDSETKQITDWVDSGTDGAISGLEYITTVKNWTIS